MAIQSKFSEILGDLIEGLGLSEAKYLPPKMVVDASDFEADYIVKVIDDLATQVFGRIVKAALDDLEVPDSVEVVSQFNSGYPTSEVFTDAGVQVDIYTFVNVSDRKGLTITMEVMGAPEVRHKVFKATLKPTDKGRDVGIAAKTLAKSALRYIDNSLR